MNGTERRSGEGGEARASVSTAASQRTLPVMTSRDLNGRPMRLPVELPGERTLLLVAFRQEQQRDVDSWIDAMALRESDLPWLELPVVPNYGALFRWYLDNGMRAGIRDTEARARVVTLYTDPAAFRASLGLGAGDRIHALVVDRTGRLLHGSEGRHSAAKESAVRAALAG